MKDVQVRSVLKEQESIRDDPSSSFRTIIVARAASRHTGQNASSHIRRPRGVTRNCLVSESRNASPKSPYGFTRAGKLSDLRFYTCRLSLVYSTSSRSSLEASIVDASSIAMEATLAQLKAAKAASRLAMASSRVSSAACRCATIAAACCAASL